MLRPTLVLAAAVVCALAPGAGALGDAPVAAAPVTPPGDKAPDKVDAADAPFDSAAAIAELRRAIAGREKEPAGKVYKNLQYLQGVPAGAVLSIMEIGMNRALGVGCNHCHKPGEWDADTDKKKVAREMSKMAKEINARLHTIEGLDADAVINCTTCHRGQVKPALDLAPAH